MTDNYSGNPMDRVLHTDTTVYTCPCGAKFEIGDPDLESWMEKHAPHTNGKVREHSSGGPMSKPFDRTKNIEKWYE